VSGLPGPPPRHHLFAADPSAGVVQGVLVRFGEIGIKSAFVRRQMVERLRQNLLDLMARESVEGDASSIGSRLWLAGPDPARLLSVARRTFGVVSASLAERVEPEWDTLLAAAVRHAMAHPAPWTSFAIRATREGDQGWTSMDLAKAAGSAVFVAAEAAGRTPKVDLTRPDLEVHIDVRAQHAFVFTETVAGPGGLPLGSQGKVVARLDTPQDTVAAWLLMRRGCSILAASSQPAGETHPGQPLVAWGWGGRMLPVPPGATGATLWGLALDHGASAAVTGDGLAEAATADEPPGALVLRPLAGLLPSFAGELAERHGLVRRG
jgi:tRNA uracil 4-sulfurtransferase